MQKMHEIISVMREKEQDVEQVVKELGEYLERLKREPGKRKAWLWKKLVKEQESKIKEMLRTGISRHAVYQAMREYVEKKFGEDYVIGRATFYRLLERLGITTKKKKDKGSERDVKTRQD